MAEHAEHLLKARIVGVYEGKRRDVFSRVANHGIVTCSCGYSTDERSSLIEAVDVAKAEHPVGRTDHTAF